MEINKIDDYTISVVETEQNIILNNINNIINEFDKQILEIDNLIYKCEELKIKE